VRGEGAGVREGELDQDELCADVDFDHGIPPLRGIRSDMDRKPQ
jgi:hypothetical protein